jgi:hypothetical protein
MMEVSAPAVEFFVGSTPMSLVHEDDRRAIYELNLSKRSFQGFLIKEPVPLGNHFHTRKTEDFTILKGGGIVMTQSVFTDGTPKGDAQKHLLTVDNCSIRIPALTAHAFVLDPGTEMICVSSEPFNPDDMDMIPCVLVTSAP